jgi:phage recombination protein Bet
MSAYTNEDVKLLVANGIIPKDTPQSQIDFFFKVCELKKLNPFLRQIHLIERRSNNNGVWNKMYSIQAGIDGMRAIAQRNGKLKDVSRGTLIKENISGKKTLYGYCKIVTDTGGVFYDEVPFNEYVQVTKEGKPTKFWLQFPETMIKKVAEESVLRMVTPEDLSGVYGDEEMQQIENPKVVTPEMLMETTQKVLSELGVGIESKETKKGNGKTKPIMLDKVVNVKAEEKTDPATVIEEKKTDIEKKPKVAKLNLKEVELRVLNCQTIEELKVVWGLLSEAQTGNDKVKKWFSIRRSQIEDELKAEKEFNAENKITEPLKEERTSDWFKSKINEIDNLPHLQNFYKKYSKEIQTLPVLQDYADIKNLIQDKEQKLKAELSRKV